MIFTWIADNAGTLFITAVLLFIVILIIKKLVRDKKRGVSSCGGNCAHCPMSGSCHK